MKLRESKLRRIIRNILVEKKFSQLPGYAKNTTMDLHAPQMVHLKYCKAEYPNS